MLISRASRRGVTFIGRWEGFRSCPYRDSVGVWTIGYGTTSAVRPVNGDTPCISQKTARRWLQRALTQSYVKAIPRRRILKQQEVDALASFAYNLGPGVVSDPNISTLARRLKSKEGRRFKNRKRIYREELPKWVNAGGRRLEGLVKRRAAEVRLACDGDYSGRP